MSGYVRDELVRRGLLADAGAPLLPKPFTPTELVERVAELRRVPT